MEERISETMSLVSGADELLRRVKGIEKRAHELAADWSAHSLVEWREGQVIADQTAHPDCLRHHLLKKKL